MLSGRTVLLILIAAALFIRLNAAIALGDTAEPVSGAYDQISYDALAVRLVSGQGFSFARDSYPFVEANAPTAHWSFLYTLYLAGVYILFGHHPLAARLFQVLISGLTIWFIYRLGRRVFGERVGLAGAAGSAFYAYLIFFNAALMTQTFYIIALLAALNIALALADNPKSTTGAWNLELGTWALLGIALGVGALFRQTMLLFAPVLFVYIWWARRNSQAAAANAEPALSAAHSSLVTGYGPLTGGYRPLITGTLVSLAVIAVLILPWTVRNYLVYHDFLLLNSNSGFWFYSSNHPDQGTNFDPTYVAPIPDELKGLPEPAIDRALLREGIGFIVSDPVRFILLSINRTKDYFWLVPSEQSSLISNASRLLSFTLYLPFMVYGLYLSRRNWRACLPLYLYAAFDTGLCLISWSAPRYRLPTDALMMVFAGLAVTTLLERPGISRWLGERFAVQNLKSEI